MNELEIEIERGVPIPDIKRHSRRKYPFYRMEVGESVLIEGDDNVVRKASSAAMIYGKRNDKKFTSRTIRREGRLIGCRIWRID